MSGGDLERLKERVLRRLSLERAIELLSSRKWNFFQVREPERLIRLEAPVGSAESYVVELPYHDASELSGMVAKLVQQWLLGARG
jgi:hypothetical protein